MGLLQVEIAKYLEIEPKKNKSNKLIFWGFFFFVDHIKVQCAR